ncbi:MAG: hypothetical protein ACYCVY_12070 [Acidiferrobacteraceae bacterium]
MGHYLDLAAKVLTKLRIAKAHNDDMHAQIQEAVEERAAIREFEGGEPRTVAEAAARRAIRVFEYRLDHIDSPWLILLAPGADLTSARETLEHRFGAQRIFGIRERAGAPQHESF